MPGVPMLRCSTRMPFSYFACKISARARTGYRSPLSTRYTMQALVRLVIACLCGPAPGLLLRFIIAQQFIDRNS